MTSETICIEITRSEGAIQRLFGLIERRGFELRSFSMPEVHPTGANDAYHVTVGIAPRDASRSIDVLSRQIGRLHGIKKIGRTGASTTSIANNHNHKDHQVTQPEGVS